MRLTAIVTALAALSLDLVAAAADADVFSSQHLYDWGWYGLFPYTTFKSYAKGGIPRVNFLSWDERCTNGYYLYTPKGRAVPKDQAGPRIMDGKGNLVWSGVEDFGQAADLQVQEYKGKKYLTFWKDTEGISMGWGRGIHYMLDENYQVYKTFRPVGEGMMSDLHEFHITREGTVLLTAYAPLTWDLRPIGGPKEGWIMDSWFQEIDIETGELLFEWRASENVPLEDTVRYFAGRDDGLTPERGFDYFHINSMDKDKSGNYIVSGRHTHSIHAVSPEGQLLWTLGGKGNQFEDLSGGKAIDFAYQHHIRIDDNDVITMFDNAKAERAGPALKYDFSRGLVIQLDQENRTAKLLHEVYDPANRKYADSQGSAQLWDGGKSMLVDYGFFPSFTEFDTETSEVLCDMRFGPSLMFPIGSVNSYRASKGNWVGKPLKRPNSLYNPAEGVLYVSWNGDTETDMWVLQGADHSTADSGPWTDLKEISKDGRFEVGFDIDASMPPWLRVAAVNKDGETLYHSQKLSREYGNVPLPDVLGDVLHALRWIYTLVVTGLGLYAWDSTRRWRATLARVAGKMWQVVKPKLRRLFFWWMPRGVRLPTWMRGGLWKAKGKPHEMQPLYDADEEQRI
ncbi:ASST-domain-containing protein [Emericellopsis atlantica]|uniref:ASST-domain-containing protein n=1 Tax=Emericellopsis atlantica TaxID=2614577 RepID=A0A9P7ZKN8_9HYPO|nr:ASST-domain-containing protein [Emericellopsis atlantica]KAG9253765.1 ASST-domain-containing protein [Emericellopsis atlantica]